MITDPFGRELLAIIEQGIADHPRSQQRVIGPSEMGDECPRALLYKLAEVDEPDTDKWQATVGTAVHTWLEARMRAHVAANGFTDWHTEERLYVGNILDVPIYGHCDLAPGRKVVDWKTASKAKLKTIAARVSKAAGMPLRTRRQVQTYGLGWDLAGLTPTTVGAFYLPRDGRLRDCIYVEEPFDRSIGEATLARCSALLSMVRAYGLSDALALYPLCDDDLCKFCTRDRARQPRVGLAHLF